MSNFDYCKSSAGWSASVVILPTNDFEILSDDDEDENSFAIDDVDFSFKVPLKIHPYKVSYDRTISKLTSKHTFVLGISVESSANSWGVGDGVRRPIRMKANSADYVASLLEIPDLTVEGAIPMEPKQHLWYYAWNYELNRKSKKSNYRPKK
ncbi:hypothetical protein RhiirC2_795450 [Rhizophagus irregularis]|uniref:DUF7276 domain-containing protein n=1 Tax=Rhizophagus irregularis TaxID=588596 RepID=A0A2N1MBI5_9GLOM|nr:hypothetical protein RhiirC2_795450 [Rhizophagus irregularis]